MAAATRAGRTRAGQGLGKSSGGRPGPEALADAADAEGRLCVHKVDGERARVGPSRLCGGENAGSSLASGSRVATRCWLRSGCAFSLPVMQHGAERFHDKERNGPLTCLCNYGTDAAFFLVALLVV